MSAHEIISDVFLLGLRLFEATNLCKLEMQTAYFHFWIGTYPSTIDHDSQHDFDNNDHRNHCHLVKHVSSHIDSRSSIIPIHQRDRRHHPWKFDPRLSVGFPCAVHSSRLCHSNIIAARWIATTSTQPTNIRFAQRRSWFGTSLQTGDT